GLKERPAATARGRITQRVHGAMLVELLCGDGGAIQAPLYATGAIDDSFGGAYEAEADFAFAWIAAEVDAVDPYRRALSNALRAVAERGLDAGALERCRRRFLGRHLRTFNTPEGLAGWMQGLALDDLAPGALLDALRAASLPALRRRLRALVAAPRAWSILDPRTGNEDRSAGH
ncbi:MAG: hypothetical protein O2894_01940, partial [Planctomycetota bacterium]|nr:hypothetical protein [Planctomycetota bacterium]